MTLGLLPAAEQNGFPFHPPGYDHVSVFPEEQGDCFFGKSTLIAMTASNPVF
jgi:hypothetical protein